MPDDAYEFLGPDLLAPPPPPPGPAPVSGTGEAPQAPPANELAPSSNIEKFQVKPAPPEKKSKEKGSGSGSDKSVKKGGKGGKKGTAEKGDKKKKRKRSASRESEPLPSLSPYKCQLVFSGITIIASVGLTLLVLIDGLM